jgi:acetolactate synthase-1/2/3 large subunit
MTKFTAVKTYEAFNLIARSRQPLVLVGRGVRIANAMEELEAFLDATNLSCVTTYLGKDCGCSTFGVIGIKGTELANNLLKECDTLLVLGASLPIAQIGYEPEFFFQRKVIIVNIEEPNKFCKPVLFIQADCREFFYEYHQLLRSPTFEP